MNSQHIAFCLDQAYGNIVPTLGIATKLVEAGNRVSYTVTQSYASLIQRIGATPVLIEPLDIRATLAAAMKKEQDCSTYDDTKLDFCHNLSVQRTAHLLKQLERLYSGNYPDLIIHDDSLDTAGRDFAKKRGIPRIRHHSQFIDKLFDKKILDLFVEDSLILMTVPEFFQPSRESLGSRFKFVGFIPEGRGALFGHWNHLDVSRKPILVSATTGLTPQRSFYATMIETFRDQPWQVIFSISGTGDRISAIHPDEMRNLPSNIQLNSSGSNFEIVKNCSLYIGQGGQGSVLEAIFWGVPQIVIAPEPYHYSVARRLNDLELGRSFLANELTPPDLRGHVTEMLADRELNDRISHYSKKMRDGNGVQLAIEIIDTYLRNQDSLIMS